MKNDTVTIKRRDLDALIQAALDGAINAQEAIDDTWDASDFAFQRDSFLAALRPLSMYITVDEGTLEAFGSSHDPLGRFLRRIAKEQQDAKNT